MEHQNIFGRIAYTSKKEELMNQPRGHETFHITKHNDGKVTLRAHCEIEEPQPLEEFQWGNVSTVDAIDLQTQKKAQAL